MKDVHRQRDPAGRGGFTLIELMIVILIIGILLSIAVPDFVSARETSRAKACVANLKQLDSATQQYAMDNKLDTDAQLTPAQFTALAPAYVRTFPLCPAGGQYAPGATVAADPTCSLSSGPSARGGPYADGQIWYHGL